MSAVCYLSSQKMLLADNMGAISSEVGEVGITRMQKLHVSKCKKVAWAYSGNAMTDSEIATYGEYITQTALMYDRMNHEGHDTGNIIVALPKSINHGNIRGSRNFFIMTARNVYSFSNNAHAFNPFECTAWLGTHGLAAMCVFSALVGNHVGDKPITDKELMDGLIRHVYYYEPGLYGFKSIRQSELKKEKFKC